MVGWLWELRIFLVWIDLIVVFIFFIFYFVKFNGIG